MIMCHTKNKLFTLTTLFVMLIAATGRQWCVK